MAILIVILWRPMNSRLFHPIQGPVVGIKGYLGVFGKLLLFARIDVTGYALAVLGEIGCIPLENLGDLYFIFINTDELRIVQGLFGLLFQLCFQSRWHIGLGYDRRTAQCPAD